MNSDTTQQIIANLKKRSAEKKEGNNHSDLKTCLIVQGGGMRGSYSMGCLWGLEELGFSDSFDYLIGSSAGAINGAYFLAKQAKIATEVYSEYITNNGFINFLRFWKILDVQYLAHILSNGKPALDQDTVRNSQTNLMFTMVHYPSAQECIISIKDKPLELMNLIKASATIPAISNEKITVDGEKYIDGAIVDPIPLKHALELGCTDIVILLTRSRTFKRKASKLLYNFLSLTYFRDWPKASKDSLFERFSAINKCYDFIWSQAANPGCRLLVVSPDQDTLAGLMSRNKIGIRKNINRGYKDVLKIFK